MSNWENGLDVHPGPDDPTPQPGVVEPQVDTPDPFGPADQPAYDGTDHGPDVGIEYLPPWGYQRAPGTVRSVVAGDIMPLNPWAPVIALLNADQVALLNTRAAARQAAGYWVDDPRKM